MIEQAFEVATEFKFDVGEAILHSNALTDSVGELNHVVNQAQHGLSFLAGSLVSHMGMGSGSLLAVLSRSVSMSEALGQQMLGFTQYYSSGMIHATNQQAAFNLQLAMSDRLLSKISNEAFKWGLNPGQLGNVMNALASSAHGRSPESMIPFARAVMRAAPMMGMNPEMLAYQIDRAMTYGMGLFGRARVMLLNSPAFREQHISNEMMWKSLPDQKKWDLALKSLDQIAGGASSLAYWMTFLRVQFDRFQAAIQPIVRALGDVIKVPMVKLLDATATVIHEHGEKLASAIRGFLGPLLKNPAALYVNLRQVMGFKEDTHKAMHWAQNLVMISWIFEMVGWLFRKLGISIEWANIRWVFTKLWSLSTWIIEMIPRMGLLVKAIKWLWGVFSELLTAFAFFEVFFALIRRAKAWANVEDVKMMSSPEIVNRMADQTKRFSSIWGGLGNLLYSFWDELAHDMAYMFQKAHWYKNIIAPIVDKLLDISEVFRDFFGTLVQFIGGISLTFYSLLEAPLKAMSENKTLTLEGYLNHIKDRIKDWKNMSYEMIWGKSSENMAVQNVVNNNYNNLNFDMREQLEPDRIAYSVIQELKKATANKTQGKGSTTTLGDKMWGGAR